MSLTELEAALVGELHCFWQDARCVRSLISAWLLAQANASSTAILPNY